jgi:hypothetical protein
MQEKELNRATIRVVSSMDISGRAAAEEIKVDLQTEEKRFFWRIASSAILRYFMAVGLLVALLAPLPASADDDKDSNHRHGDYASVSGGQGNNAFDDFTSITGGTGNTAGSDVTFQGGLGATVTGGSGNHAGGRYTVVIGGQNVIDNNDNSVAPKPPFP